jgi:hypothetical protein
MFYSFLGPLTSADDGFRLWVKPITVFVVPVAVDFICLVSPLPVLDFTCMTMLFNSITAYIEADKYSNLISIDFKLETLYQILTLKSFPYLLVFTHKCWKRIFALFSRIEMLLSSKCFRLLMIIPTHHHWNNL